MKTTSESQIVLHCYSQS